MPERDRRHAAREVLRKLDLIGSEQRDAEAARSPQQLVQRRLAADRDPDERRLERDGTSEATVSPRRSPSRSTVTTLTPTG